MLWGPAAANAAGWRTHRQMTGQGCQGTQNGHHNKCVSQPAVAAGKATAAAAAAAAAVAAVQGGLGAGGT